MKNQKLDKDQFSKFIAELILSTKNHSFDVFYDIKRIVLREYEVMHELSKTRDYNKPQVETFILMNRDCGFDLVKPNDELYETYKQRNDKIYELKFCWNNNYLGFEVPYCEVKEI